MSRQPCQDATSESRRDGAKAGVALTTLRRALVVLCGLVLTATGAAAAETKVVATIKPIHALVAGVMDGVGAPQLLVTGAASPHTFALKPSGARALNDADVVFRVSPAVEPFTVKITAALPKSVRVVTLASAAGVRLLAARHDATFTGHDHAHEAEDSATAAAQANSGAFDGHVWLDPENAKAMVREIARVLAEVYPDDAARFGDNARNLQLRIDALDREIKDMLGPVREQPYVVFHDAYQYFERRYGLAPVGAITVGPEIQPGAKRLSEIRNKVAKLGAVCMFAEPQFSGEVLRAMTDGATARFGTLDPEGALVEPGEGAYAGLMRNLAKSLHDCLAGPVQKGANLRP